MEKTRYYVKVETGEILRDKTASEWEFEIEATEDEAKRLRMLLENANAASDGSFLNAFSKGKNNRYDEVLPEIYQVIHDLGDEDAKNIIDSMDILK